MSRSFKPSEAALTSKEALLEALKAEHIDPLQRRRQLYDALGLKTSQTAHELEERVQYEKTALSKLSERENRVMEQYFQEMEKAIRELRIIEQIEEDSQNDTSSS